MTRQASSFWARGVGVRALRLRPIAAARNKKPAPGMPRAGFDLLQLQFRSVTGIYPGSVTLSSAFYRSGQILQNFGAAFHKTAKFDDRM